MKTSLHSSNFIGEIIQARIDFFVGHSGFPRSLNCDYQQFPEAVSRSRARCRNDVVVNFENLVSASDTALEGRLVTDSPAIYLQIKGLRFDIKDFEIGVVGFLLSRADRRSLISPSMAANRSSGGNFLRLAVVMSKITASSLLLSECFFKRALISCSTKSVSDVGYLMSPLTSSFRKPASAYRLAHCGSEGSCPISEQSPRRTESVSLFGWFRSRLFWSIVNCENSQQAVTGSHE